MAIYFVEIFLGIVFFTNFHGIYAEVEYCQVATQMRAVPAGTNYCTKLLCEKDGNKEIPMYGYANGADEEEACRNAAKSCEDPRELGYTYKEGNCRACSTVMCNKYDMYPVNVKSCLDPDGNVMRCPAGYQSVCYHMFCGEIEAAGCIGARNKRHVCGQLDVLCYNASKREPNSGFGPLHVCNVCNSADNCNTNGFKDEFPNDTMDFQAKLQSNGAPNPMVTKSPKKRGDNNNNKPENPSVTPKEPEKSTPPPTETPSAPKEDLKNGEEPGAEDGSVPPLFLDNIILMATGLVLLYSLNMV